MSNAVGEVWSRDGKLYGYFEYQGVTDTAIPNVYLKREELSAAWRKHEERRCNCGATGTAVVLYSSYGGGFYWDGTICWNCLVITKGINPDDSDIHTSREGHPFLDAWMIETYGRVLPCPKCGEQELTSDVTEAHIKCKRCGKNFYLWELSPKAITKANINVVAEQ